MGPAGVLNVLYGEFLERGIRYFFPACHLEVAGKAEPASAGLAVHDTEGGGVTLDWFGVRYRLDCPPLTPHQRRLIRAIGSVLFTRYRSIFSPASGPASHLFHNPPEDSYVSAFLDRTAEPEQGLTAGPDVMTDALQVLRESSLITYENRRISSGALLLGTGKDPHHPRPGVPEGALPYNSELVAIKSFNRLCDGLHTVLLVNREGLMVDVVDVDHWSRSSIGEAPATAPAAARYRPHTLATVHGGHICLVLTPNGEIKVFAEGAQMFSFLEGRWRLTDSAVKFEAWRAAVGNDGLAERLFVTARNLAENRRGGLFVVLDDPAAAGELLGSGDLVTEAGNGKGQIHYLLRGKRVVELEPAVLESIARVDGAVVLDRGTNLLAFGAILRHPEWTGSPVFEGGRTTAAAYASRFGLALKISEDGIVSFYRGGAGVWEI